MDHGSERKILEVTTSLNTKYHDGKATELENSNSTEPKTLLKVNRQVNYLLPGEGESCSIQVFEALQLFQNLFFV